MIAYIDESGDHNLNLAKIDNQYNIFVLAAILISEKSNSILDKKFKSLKQELFGTDEFIVHTAEITRPSRAKDPLNFKFNDPKFRGEFYEDVNKMIEDIDMKIITCAIHKDKHLEKYGINAQDPYEISFNNVLDNLFAQAKNLSISIYPEKRGRIEDVKLDLTFTKKKITGTKRFSASYVDKHIEEFKLVEKEENISGMQLADLIVSPIGRYLIGKRPRPIGNEIIFSVIENKIPEGCLSVFPL